jgi:hypothetical protein
MDIRSPKLWIALILIAVTALAAMLIMGIAAAGRGLKELSDVAAETEIRSNPAPANSVVLVATNEVGKIDSILGFRGGLVGPDSLMVYNAHLIPSSRRIELDVRKTPWVGLIEPINDWTKPITIRLTDSPTASDTVTRHGRLHFGESHPAIPVYELRRRQ